MTSKNPIVIRRVQEAGRKKADTTVIPKVEEEIVYVFPLFYIDPEAPDFSTLVAICPCYESESSKVHKARNNANGIVSFFRKNLGGDAPDLGEFEIYFLYPEQVPHELVYKRP